MVSIFNDVGKQMILEIKKKIELIKKNRNEEIQFVYESLNIFDKLIKKIKEEFSQFIKTFFHFSNECIKKSEIFNYKPK